MAQLLGQVSEGTLVKLNESGKPVEFYVAKQNYESGLNGSGRVLLVRKDCYDNRQWDSGDYNSYANSDIDTWFNSTYKNMLDSDICFLIGTTKIRYTPSGSSGVSTLDRSIFALSLTELGESSSYANVEGSALPIANILKIAHQNGTAANQWTRSPYKGSATYNVFGIFKDGSVGYRSCSDSLGSRPTFTISSDAYVYDDGSISRYIGPAPTIFTHPVIAMQGVSIPLSWSAVDGASSYIVQRKVDGGSWTQVYSGSATTFTDTAGSWSTVQYQVCGVFNGTNGAFATSTTITILSASALVISGEDEDLGTITNDVKYSVASNTGNPISLTRFVNGIQVAALTVNSGFSYSIPVVELPTGSGTIVITATVQSSSGPVTQTRTWTYTKTPVTFPDAGAVGVLAKGGQNVLPVTAAEAVRVSPAWGGSLDKALDFIRGPGSIVRSYPIASGQTVTAGQVVDVTSDIPPTVGQYVPGSIQVQNVPVGSFITRTENGVPQYYLVVHQGLPSSMYDASCNGTWVLRLNIYENAAWDAGNSNVLPGADIFSTMAGMLSLFDAETQAAIKTVKIPYCVGGGSSTVQSGADGLECQIFPLGGYEYGITTAQQSALPVDGAALAYFSNYTSNPNRILANFDGDLTNHWTRSQNTTSSQYPWYVVNSATLGSTNASDTNRGIRPAFILNPTLEVDGYYEGVSEAITTSGTPSQAIALQGGSAGDVIPVIFQGVAQLSGVTQGQQITSSGVYGFGAMDGWLSVFPYWLFSTISENTPKVIYGQYIGTGSVGQSNPVVIQTPSRAIAFFITEKDIGNYLGRDYYSGFWWRGNSKIMNTGGTPNVTVTNSSISYYHSNNEFYQFNGSGTTYCYFAICE